MPSKREILTRALKSRLGIDIETFTADEVLIVAGISKGNVDRLGKEMDSSSSKNIDEFLKNYVKNDN